MLTEAEKSVQLERTQPSLAPPASSRKRLLWGSAVAIAALAAAAFLLAYAHWIGGGRDAGTDRAAHPLSAAHSEGTVADIPLPSRRPAALGGQQSPGRGAPGSAAN
jgi:hypothetical protein